MKEVNRVKHIPGKNYPLTENNSTISNSLDPYGESLLAPKPPSTHARSLHLSKVDHSSIEQVSLDEVVVSNANSVLLAGFETSSTVLVVLSLGSAS